MVAKMLLERLGLIPQSVGEVDEGEDDEGEEPEEYLES
jgi:hypothetical protein